jgi:hypothetical protein
MNYKKNTFRVFLTTKVNVDSVDSDPVENAGSSGSSENSVTPRKSLLHEMVTIVESLVRDFCSHSPVEREAVCPHCMQVDPTGPQGFSKTIFFFFFSKKNCFFRNVSIGDIGSAFHFDKDSCFVRYLLQTRLDLFVGARHYFLFSSFGGRSCFGAFDWKRRIRVGVSRHIGRRHPSCSQGLKKTRKRKWFLFKTKNRKWLLWKTLILLWKSFASFNTKCA